MLSPRLPRASLAAAILAAGVAAELAAGAASAAPAAPHAPGDGDDAPIDRPVDPIAPDRARTGRDPGDGRDLAAIAPPTGSRGDAPGHGEEPASDDLAFGIVSVVRIDGKGRGFAAGAGVAIARAWYDIEVMALRSSEFGGYAGLRIRPFTGRFRPYAAAGFPAFVFDHAEQVDGAAQTTTRLGVGVRAAAGLELAINGHVSVTGDLGYEHFFFVDDRFEADLFVPSLGVIGRL